MIKKINHVGVMVKSLETALGFYRDALGLEAYVEDYTPDQLRIAFLTVGEAKFQLAEPTSAESPIAKILEKQGEGIHHISLEVDDLRTIMEKLTGAGVVLLDREPQRGADDLIKVFVDPGSTGGVLIELSQKER